MLHHLNILLIKFTSEYNYFSFNFQKYRGGTLYTGPNPPWPSLFSDEKFSVASAIWLKSKNGKSELLSLLQILDCSLLDSILSSDIFISKSFGIEKLPDKFSVKQVLTSNSQLLKKQNLRHIFALLSTNRQWDSQKVEVPELHWR